jgi:hypothetical protein
MTNAKTSSILDDLFGTGSDNKESVLDNLLKKAEPKQRKNKKPSLADEAIVVHRFDAPSMQTAAIVMLRVVDTCECCGKKTEHANKHLFAKKVDKWGNMHETQYITKTDVENPKIPRIVETEQNTISMCESCFLAGAKIKPVMTDDAKDSIKPNGDTVGQQFKNNDDLESQIDAIWAKIQGE